jgi:hypothetical protein
VKSPLYLTKNLPGAQLMLACQHSVSKKKKEEKEEKEEEIQSAISETQVAHM